MIIVTDLASLAKKCKHVSVEEGEKIAAKLLKTLAVRKDTVGLAANQVGIDASVCVVNVKEPLYFINPEILETKGEIFYVEGCASFPNKKVKTKRFTQVTVEADNFDKPITFGSVDEKMSGLELLEVICVQHEIDHINGVTMFDREAPKLKPVKNENKFGRNEKVKVKNNITGEVEVIKYKKVMNDLGNDKTWMVLD